MRYVLSLLPMLAMSAALSAEPTYELHQTFTIPAGGWIRTNPGATIPVYECDPHALDEVAGRADAFIVLPRGLGVFIASGRGDFYYWQVSRSMQAASQTVDRAAHALAAAGHIGQALLEQGRIDVGAAEIADLAAFGLSNFTKIKN